MNGCRSRTPLGQFHPVKAPDMDGWGMEKQKLWSEEEASKVEGGCL